MSIENGLFFSRTDRTFYRDYLPVVSTFTNLIEIFIKCAYKRANQEIPNNLYCFSHISQKSLKKNILLLVPFFGNLIVLIEEVVKQCTAKSGAVAVNGPINKPIYWKERDVIANLKKQGYLDPIEAGGGGDCLFHSTRVQMSLIEGLSLSQNWQRKSKKEQAAFLRRKTVEKEQELILSIKGKPINALTDIEKLWLKVLYIDMQILLANRKHDLPALRRETAGDTNYKQFQQYCCQDKHFSAYLKASKRDAGGAELIALSLVLKRPFKLFGLDFSLHDRKYPPTDGKGNINPILQSSPSSFSSGLPVLTIFQTGNGEGGHFMCLRKRA